MDYSKERKEFKQLATLEPGLRVLEAAIMECAEVCKSLENYDKTETWYRFAGTFIDLIGPAARIHFKRMCIAESDALRYLESLLPDCTDENCDCCEREQ